MPSRLAVLARSVLAGAVVGAALAIHPAAAQSTISIACGSVGIEFELCKSGAEAWAKKTGNQVRVVSTPKESNEALALYQQLLASKSADIDVLRIDVVWPGLLAQHLVALEEQVPKAVVAQHFPAIIEANTVAGHLVALPWFTDAGLLYYRKDLLEKYGQKVPTTWEELTQTAKLVQDAERKAGNAKMWGFVFQGRAYEGLTCNALEWIDSFGGGAGSSAIASWVAAHFKSETVGGTTVYDLTQPKLPHEGRDKFPPGISDSATTTRSTHGGLGRHPRTA